MSAPKIKSVESILSEMKAQKATHEVMATGLSSVDDCLDGGFFKGELVVIGAATGTGKSIIASQLTLNITNQGFKSGYFSLELGDKAIISRMIGQLSNIKPTRVRFGFLTPDETKRKLEATARLLALGDTLGVCDDVYKYEELAAEIKASGFEFVVIDFIQNVLDNAPDEYQRLSNVALKLQELAKEANCCILVISQLSNSVAREGAGGRTLEYKGSGSISTVCDLGFILERDEDSGANQLNAATTHDLKLVLKKNRRGVSGFVFPLKYQNPGGKIYE